MIKSININQQNLAHNYAGFLAGKYTSRQRGIRTLHDVLGHLSDEDMESVLYRVLEVTDGEAIISEVSRLEYIDQHQSLTGYQYRGVHAAIDTFTAAIEEATDARI